MKLQKRHVTENNSVEGYCACGGCSCNCDDYSNLSFNSTGVSSSDRVGTTQSK